MKVEAIPPAAGGVVTPGARILLVSPYFPLDEEIASVGVHQRMRMFVDALKGLGELDVLFFVPASVDTSRAAVRAMERSFSERWNATLELFLCSHFGVREPISPLRRADVRARSLLGGALSAMSGAPSVMTSGPRQVAALEACLQRKPEVVFAHRLGAMAPLLRTRLPHAPVPELLYRHFTGLAGFEPDPSWAADGTGSSSLVEVDNWSRPILERMEVTPALPRRSWRSGFRRRWPPRPHQRSSSLDWMPAARYRAAWPGMDAYAIPAYYDARVRVNLRGRESFGTVSTRRYQRVLDEVEQLVRECRDAATDEPLSVEFERAESDDPLQRASTDSDMVLRFHKDHYGFRHPRLGMIGPAPCRRPGGHTGGNGVGWFFGQSSAPIDLGTYPYPDIVSAVRGWMGATDVRDGLGAALLAAEAARRG